jgi:hypothetical protein
MLPVLAQAEIVEQTRSLNFFSGPVLFQDLEQTVLDARIWVTSIACLILFFGVLGKIQSGDLSERPFIKVVFIFVAMIAMANSSKILQFSMDMAEAFSESLGMQSSASLAEHVMNIDHTLSPEDTINDEVEIQKTSKNPFKIVSQQVDSTKSWFKALILSGGLGVIKAMLWGCGWIITLFETARFFMLQMSSLLFPIFIAGLLTRSFHSQSISYIFGLIAIICWPIGWAIGHLGTRSLFTATGRIIKADLVMDEQAAEAAGAISDSIANGSYNEASLAGIDALSMLGWGTILSAVIMLALTCGWILVVTIMVPRFMQSLFSSGADLFTGAMGNIGSVVGGVAGSAVGSLAGGAASTGAKMAAGAGQAAISPVATVKAASAGVQAFGAGARAFGASKLAGAKEVASFGARTAINTTTMPQKAESTMLKAAQSFNKRAGSR